MKLKIEHIDKHTGMILLEILELKPNCSFCNKDITEENFGGIFSKPTRICCDKIFCLSEMLSEEL